MDKNALIIAVIHRDIRNIRTLLQKDNTNVNYANQHGNTALTWGAYHGYADCLQILLEAGAKTESQVKMDGKTALMYAVEKQHTDCVRILIEAGACPKNKNCLNLSSLDIAQDVQNPDILDLLKNATQLHQQADAAKQYCLNEQKRNTRQRALRSYLGNKRYK